MSELKVGLIEMADDGTLFIAANVDGSKVSRILLWAEGTALGGGLFYPDTDEVDMPEK